MVHVCETSIFDSVACKEIHALCIIKETFNLKNVRLSTAPSGVCVALDCCIDTTLTKTHISNVLDAT